MPNDSLSDVSVIIPSSRQDGSLQTLIGSLPKGVQVIVVTEKGSLAHKRNVGWRRATGKYLLFVDDDNRMKTGAIEEAIRCFRNDPDVGVVGFMGRYSDNKELVWDGGSNRSLLTGFTTGENLNRKYKYVDATPYEVDEVANCFMVREDLMSWGFDEESFPIDLDEADLCIRIKMLGYKVVVAPLAVTFHPTLTHSRIPDFRRPMNAYYMGRNRILFQKFYCSHIWIYFLAFLPPFVLSYVLCLACRWKFQLIYHFLKGVTDGLLNKTDRSERYTDWR